MAMSELQHMVRIPISWWGKICEYGKPIGKDGAELVREALQIGAPLIGIDLPADKTATASGRKARKVARLEAELAALK